jgi:aryl-alcohol dehydrogenase-like predicted oxidoreductase
MKLGLGTVQFGMDYGVSNQLGQTPPDRVNQILKFAVANGIHYLDTAPAYGNSESVLGELLDGSDRFRIVTKTDKVGKSSIEDSDIEIVLRTFDDSLKHLRQNSVYGLLVHHPDDLLAEGGEQLFHALLSLKSQGLVKKIGVSVYDKLQIERLCIKYAIDIIQIPLNVFDRRLLQDGYLQSLKQNHKLEIHVRSVFLQGLLLMNEEEVPPYLSAISPHLSKYRQANAARGISNLQAAIGFVDSLPEVDVVLVGVNDLPQLQEIVSSLDEFLDFSYLNSFGIEDTNLINPSTWSK